jgi:hypothetical protein
MARSWVDQNPIPPFQFATAKLFAHPESLAHASGGTDTMTPSSPKILRFSRRTRSETGALNKKAARKGAKRTPVTSNVPGRAADPAEQSSRLLRPRTAGDIANEETAEQLALRIWAAIVAKMVLSGMSALMDEYHKREESLAKNI